MSFLTRLLGSGDRSKPAPIIADPQERGYEKDFRRPDDPPFVVRVNQRALKGLPAKFANYIPVAGISHDEAKVNATRMIAGTSRRIELEQDPTNQYDPNAIKIIGVWTDPGGEECRGRIGYLPADIAGHVVRHGLTEKLGVTIESMFRPRDGKSPGMRIDLWCPRGTRKYGEGES